jgi:hypothetical protein
MDTTTETVNSRVQEFEFLISILNDLAHKYQGHNTRLLEEIISNFEYRRETEETTIIAKSRSEEFQRQKYKFRK